MFSDDVTLWVDLNEIFRAAHGFPDEPTYAHEVFEASLSTGNSRHNPRTSLIPFVRHRLGHLQERAIGGCLGVDCGIAARSELALDAHFEGMGLLWQQMEACHGGS